MKKVLTFTGAVLVLASLFLFSVAQAASSDHFVIEVTITDGGDTTFTIPTFPGETYNYDVDWDNDQTFEDTANTGDATHDFTTTGTYTVRIDGTFPRIYFNNTGDKLKLTDVSQWGTGTWTSMANAFYGATNLEVTATDAPDLSNVTDMSYMFANVDALDQDLGDWDVSNVTDMSYLFYDADGLQGNVGTFETRVDYAGAGTSPRFLQTADLNGDGYSDMVISASEEIRVFFNDGDGTFTYDDSYAAAGNNVIFGVGDIDGDGDNDIVRAVWSGFVVYKNDGVGNFSLYAQFATTSGLLGVQLGDIDDDGDLDMVGVNYGSGLVATMLNDGNGTFSGLAEYVVYAEMFTLKMADLNGDGYEDIVAAAASYTKLFVMINNQDGTFASPVQYGPAHSGGYYARGISLVDMDLDGDVDIVGSIKFSTTPISVMMNNGSGVFGSPATYAVSDPHYTWAAETGDFNRDGYPDVVVGQVTTGNRVTVLLNDGDGTLGSAVDYTVAAPNESVAVADFDKDGNLDIASGNSNGTLSILFNKNLSLNLWDTSSVTTMAHMFDGAGGFNQSVAAWNVANVTDMSGMFTGVTLATETYDDMLLEWYDQNLQRSVTLDAGNSKYCAGVYAQANLTTRYAWSITDGGADADYTCIPVAISTGYLGGGATSHLQSSCTPSATTVEIGDEVSFTIDIDTTEDNYEFEWTKVLSGDDEDETYTFDTAGTFYPRAQVRTTNLGTHTVNCGTITVTEGDEDADDNDSSSSSREDSDDQDDETESDTTDTAIETLVREHRTFLLSLQASGITLPANVTALLAQTTTNTTSFTFTRDLELDMTGPDVTALQQLLIAQGYAIPAGATGYFGAQTQTALIQFQIAKGIVPAAGYFGPATRAVVEGL